MSLKMDEIIAKDIITEWYSKIDNHAPAKEIIALVDFNEFSIISDDVTVNSVESFREWYAKLISLFFDECHKILCMSVQIEGDTARVRTEVNATGRMWMAPAAKSIFVEYDTAQVFKVKINDGKAVLVSYEVEYMNKVER